MSSSPSACCSQGRQSTAPATSLKPPRQCQDCKCSLSETGEHLSISLSAVMTHSCSPLSAVQSQSRTFLQTSCITPFNPLSLGSARSPESRMNTSSPKPGFFFFSYCLTSWHQLL